MKENTEKRVPKADVKLSLRLSDEQKQAKAEILNHAYSFVLGRAGSGKTLLAVSIALDRFFKREINKIIVTRPTVASENNGFIPGTPDEKMKPWLVPIIDNISKAYDKPSAVQRMFTEQSIEIIALTYFRGRTFENAVCIVDEFQNLTQEQLSMCIGRLGENSIMIFCGDGDQIDLKNRLDSAYMKVDKLTASKHVYKVELQENYRHPAVKDVLELFYSK